MIHLREMVLSIPAEKEGYPFDVPVVGALSKLVFSAPMMIFVGENGSGKSTIMEALAAAVGSIVVGSAGVEADETLKKILPLARAMKLVWNKRTHRGFFLRAEDFFGYIKGVRDLRNEMLEDLDRVDRTYQDRSDLARSLAKMPAASSLHALETRYGEDPDARSHGESFLDLFQSRCVPNGLYLLDEPEAALSPIRQMSLIAMMRDMVADQNAQFIIATHSPILMAFPGAVVLDFDRIPPEEVSYDDLEHVKLYRAFLENPAAFLRRL